MINCSECGGFISCDWSNLSYICDNCQHKIDWVEDLKNDNEFMSGVLEGFEDYRNGRTELWPDVKVELGLS